MDFFTFRKECQYFQPENVFCKRNDTRCFMSTCPLLKGIHKLPEKKVCPKCGDGEGFMYIIKKHAVGKWGQMAKENGLKAYPDSVLCKKCNKEINRYKAEGIDL